MAFGHRNLTLIALVSVAVFGGLTFSGCDALRTMGTGDGVDGSDGLNCWDLDGDGEGDADEDTNGDGKFDALDCIGPAGNDGAIGPQGPPGEGAATFVVSSMAELVDALTNLPPNGGRIVARAGRYSVASTIDLKQDNLVIEGEGAATLFVLADGADCPVFVVGEPIPFQPALTHRNITLRNFRINGNRANQTTEACTDPGREHLRNNGITLRQVADCTVENVLIEGARSGGIVFEQTCTNIVLHGVITEDNEFDGIAWDGVITNSVISESTSRNNVAAGLSFDIGPDGNLIVDSFFVDNGSVGVFIRDSRRNLFANCFIARNGEDGVFIADGDAPGASTSENYFDADMFVDNSRNGIWQAGANSVNNVVDGGLFCGNGMTAIEESFPVAAPLVAFDTTVCP